jgi:DNA-directed RNA polymerase specialized sigma24 family protein
MDELRAANRLLLADDLDGEPVEVGRPVYAEIEHLTGDLPPKERAAVVLRYGYDLPYDEIGAALGSSEEAARAAASSGVRRLRRRLSAPTSGRACFARASVCDADQEQSRQRNE